MNRADPLRVERPALAAIELSSIARGIVVLDQMAKRAEPTIVAARTLSPGRYLIMISGLVAEVEEAMDAANSCAEDERVDHVIIRDPQSDLRKALACELNTALEESLAIVELTCLSSTLLALDRTLKESQEPERH